MEYEGLHLICFSCGKFDHRADKCPEAIVTEAQRARVDGATNMQVEGSSGEHEVVVPDGGEEKSEAIFGVWMIAKKPSRRRRNSAKPVTVANGEVVPSVSRAAKGGVQGNQSGSRFASLAHGEDNAMQVEMSLQPHPIGADSSDGPVTQAPHRPNKGADKGSTKAPLKRKLSATQKPIPATPKPTTSQNTLAQQNSDMPSKRFPLDSSGDKQPMTGVVIARQISVPHPQIPKWCLIGGHFMCWNRWMSYRWEREERSHQILRRRSRPMSLRHLQFCHPRLLCRAL